MTQDPAAKAATEIVEPNKSLYFNADQREVLTEQERSAVAAIIRRAYEPRERLLERAVAACQEMIDEYEAGRSPRFDIREACRSVLAEAASMGIGGK